MKHHELDAFVSSIYIAYFDSYKCLESTVTHRVTIVTSRGRALTTDVKTLQAHASIVTHL